MKKIPFALPDISKKEIQSVKDTLKSGWITSGPKVIEFEKKVKKHIGCKYSIAVNSATAGLHLALKTIGLTREDKVIVPVYTFAATAEVVQYFKAEVIFCDVDSKTLNIHPKEIEKLCQKHKNIKAVIPVHFAGTSCDMNGIMQVARKNNLIVIEDAAHAFGSTYKEKQIGNIGDIVVFSFYATKTITTGEGGMVTTNNREYARKISLLRLHGINHDIYDRDNKKINKNRKRKNWQYEIVEAGYKYNMSDIMAAIGIEQLKRHEKMSSKRLKIAMQYDLAFQNLKNVEVLYKPFQEEHSNYLYVIKVYAKKRDWFMEELKKKGVGTSVHFIPLHLHSYWKKKYNLKKNDFPIAYKEYLKVVSLPIYSKMKKKDVLKVIKAVKEINTYTTK